jgi:hypothetical protein
MKNTKRMSNLQKLIAQDWHPGKAALAGTLATATYSLAMEGDKLLLNNHFSDVRFIEGIVAGRKREKRFWLLAWLLHFLNGVALAEAYAALFKRLLPGPNWLKGALFSEIFIIGAWGLTPLADKYHPLIKDGEMPQLANWKAFYQNLLRHLVFGLTLGLIYEGKK